MWLEHGFHIAHVVGLGYTLRLLEVHLTGVATAVQTVLFSQPTLHHNKFAVWQCFVGPRLIISLPQGSGFRPCTLDNQLCNNWLLGCGVLVIQMNTVALAVRCLLAWLAVLQGCRAVLVCFSTHLHEWCCGMQVPTFPKGASACDQWTYAIPDDNMAGLKHSERPGLPSLEGFARKALRQMDPEAGIEEEYKLIRTDAVYTWKLGRLLASRCLEIPHDPEYIEDKLAAALPTLIPAGWVTRHPPKPKTAGGQTTSTAPEEGEADGQAGNAAVTSSGEGAAAPSTNSGAAQATGQAGNAAKPAAGNGAPLAAGNHTQPPNTAVGAAPGGTGQAVKASPVPAAKNALPPRRAAAAPATAQATNTAKTATANDTSPVSTAAVAAPTRTGQAGNAAKAAAGNAASTATGNAAPAGAGNATRTAAGSVAVNAAGNAAPSAAGDVAADAGGQSTPLASTQAVAPAGGKQTGDRAAAGNKAPPSSAIEAATPVAEQTDGSGTLPPSTEGAAAQDIAASATAAATGHAGSSATMSGDNIEQTPSTAAVAAPEAAPSANDDKQQESVDEQQ